MNHCLSPTSAERCRASGTLNTFDSRSRIQMGQKWKYKLLSCSTKMVSISIIIEDTYSGRVLLAIGIISYLEHNRPLLERVFPVEQCVARFSCWLLIGFHRAFVRQVWGQDLTLKLVRNCVWLLIRKHFDIVIFIIIIILVFFILILGAGLIR